MLKHKLRNRINSMLRSSGSGDNSVHAWPTAEAGMGDNNVNARAASVTGFGDGNVNARATSDTGFGDGNVNATQHFFIGDDCSTSAATADYRPRTDRHKHLTREEKQAEIRHQQILEGERQEAFTALMNKSKHLDKSVHKMQHKLLQ